MNETDLTKINSHLSGIERQLKRQNSFKQSFLRGLMAGLGATIGLAIVLSVLAFVINQVAGILGQQSAAENLIELINQ